MKRTAIAILLLSLGSPALADSFRSDRHLVKIDVQSLGTSRQYDVQVFDAESRHAVTRLQVVTRGSSPEEAQTTAGGTLYEVRIEPHGKAYLVDFRADDGESVDAMRAGFLPPATTLTPPSDPLRAGRDVPVPKTIRRVEAVYTEEARAAGAAGTVILDVLIDRSGFVRDARVLKRMGYGLDESAADALKQWQFEPPVRELVPVEVLYEVTVEFKP